jgi:hypothetical protein
MHSEDQPRAFTDRLVIISELSPVGGPDLAKPGTRSDENVRNAEVAADLYQFASRDYHLTARGKFGQNQERRGRTVVNKERRFSTGQLTQKFFGVRPSASALSALDVELNIAVSRCCFRHGPRGFFRERRAPKICVNHNAGCVYYSVLAATPHSTVFSFQAILRDLGKGRAGIYRTFGDLIPQGIDHASRQRGNTRRAKRLRESFAEVGSN